jgi:hypothetical protein
VSKKLIDFPGWGRKNRYHFFTVQGPEEFFAMRECKKSPSRERKIFLAWASEEQSTARTS